MRYLTRLIPFIVAFGWVVFSLAGGSPVAAASPLILPAGFIDEVAYGGLLAPRAFAFLPDGRVLAVERNSPASANLASIRVFLADGTLLTTPAYTLTICGDSERGLLGITVDPNFATNGYIYIYYTRQATIGTVLCATNTFTNGIASGPRNVISRLTLFGDVVVPLSERVLIDSIVSERGNHNAGDLQFGADGYLYASTGDGGVSWTAPHTGTLNGKIIRILPTPGDLGGYTTSGNPYDVAGISCKTIAPFAPGAVVGPCKEIYASGFRNPFRFTMQPTLAGIPGSGSPFVGDVGQNTWEEVDQVQSGGDYGWPEREGYCPISVLCLPPYQNGGYQNPIYAYPHDPALSYAIIGGDFYTGGADYPMSYMNNYFFAEFVQGFIARLIYAGNGQWIRLFPDFATGGSGLVGLKRGPDGNLYYLTTTSASSRVDAIRRIRYEAPGTAAPPRNYFTTPTPTLTWNRVTWAVAYEVQVANNAGFIGATIYPAGNNLAIMLPPQNTGFYYWRVRACATTCSGGWSVMDTFVVDVP